MKEPTNPESWRAMRDWPFPTIKAFPKGSHTKADAGSSSFPGNFWPKKEFDIDGDIWTGLDDKRLRQFYTFHYAVLLFKQKPLSYLELHGIDPESEEGKRHMALWMKHRLEGE